MKPEFTPSPDGKRSQAKWGSSTENRADDLEKDLWDLDDEPTIPQAPEAEPAPAPLETILADATEKDEVTEERDGPAAVPVAPRRTRRDLSFKQELPKSHAEPSAEASSGEPGRHTGATAFSKHVTGSSVSNNTFDDLEHSLADHEPEESPQPIAPAAVIEPEYETENETETEISAEPVEAAPVAPALAKGLSTLERLGLAGFAALLVATIVFFLINSLNKLPEEQKPLTPGDLPIAGQKISADKISSYWREPNTSAGETVRRGTLLLPVVELGVSGGPGAIRVFFRDSDGATVGDGVTRSVQNASTLTLSATAGFDDEGMFAAYRTGDSKPWKIEVFEGPSERAAGSEFKKLFEIPISTQRR